MNPPVHAPEPASRTALRAALASLDAAQAAGRPWALAEAYREVAHGYGGIGALPSALAMLTQALRWARATGATDQCVDLHCEIVEMLARQADGYEQTLPGSGRPTRDLARDHVFEATRLATRVADARWEVTVLLRLSDVLDRFGDRDDATLLQVRALQLTVGASLEPQRPNAADAALLRRH